MDSKLSKKDAVFAASALRAVSGRLRLKDDNTTADRLDKVAELLEKAQTIIVTDARHLS